MPSRPKFGQVQSVQSVDGRRGGLFPPQAPRHLSLSLFLSSSLSLSPPLSLLQCQCNYSSCCCCCYRGCAGLRWAALLGCTWNTGYYYLSPLMVFLYHHITSHSLSTPLSTGRVAACLFCWPLSSSLPAPSSRRERSSGMARGRAASAPQCPHQHRCLSSPRPSKARR